MRNLLHPLMLSAAMLAGGCAFFSDNYLRDVDFPGVYKIDIQQGNVVESSLVDQLKPNMSKQQVLSILGTPLVVETFNQNRWDYIKSVQPGGGPRKQERVSVFFQDNRLVKITGAHRPKPTQDLEQEVNP